MRVRGVLETVNGDIEARRGFFSWRCGLPRGGAHLPSPVASLGRNKLGD